MEPILTTTAVTGFLALLFQEGGKTLAAESVKLALEKRHDIKDKLVELFRPELISLNLNETQTSEEVRALLTAKPEIAESVQNKVENNSELLKELLEIIKTQKGKDSSQITVNAEKVGQVINDNHGTINQTVNFS